jgi:SAM-dependent methyltransferase
MAQHKNFSYFENLAAKRIKIRKTHSYYWKDISSQFDYFIQEDSRVIEIGCGTGELLAEVRGAYKMGIDYSPAMIAQAKENGIDAHFEVMDAEDVSSINQKFDVIILSNLTGYLDDVQYVFNELHKISHPKTRIIVNYYNFVWEPILKFAERIGLKQKTPKQNWLSTMDINNLLFLAGFDVYRNTPRTLIPFNIPIISWFFNKYMAKMPIIKHLCLNQFTFARPQPVLTEAEYSQKYTTTVVIPARNESGNIENAILRLPKFGKDIEIIFVEGNSTDDTWQKIQEIKAKYGHSHNIKITQQDGKGKGDAVRKGYNIATGDILMILDADLTMPPEDLPKFYDAIASGKGEFINGCRLVYAMDDKAMRFLNLLGNKFFSIAFTWLLSQSFKDTLCGTKVMFRKDYEKLKVNRKFFGEFDPFGDFDLLFGAYKLNLKMVDLPIRYKERTYGDTNISRFKHGLILLRMCAFAARKVKFT